MLFFVLQKNINFASQANIILTQDLQKKLPNNEGARGNY
jgi:hypothetical protein